ncbi:TPA: anaerobic ribonucleoside-triphosphate reductase activating protein [Candidatus Acetothermia bacterium]|nr:anaerobic ribonucleoside-triphosphate reductase activating protein [Candidatus Acetothermia bacterium]
MEIAHLQLLSLLDYPGRVSAVVWTVGCNLRCPFCYNGELVLPELGADLPQLSPRGVLGRLRERAGFLDGVVVTGGEPTLHPDLPTFLREVKRLGFLVKLDTNGTRPAVVRSLAEDRLVDYVAVDVKAPFSRYPEFTGISGDREVADLSAGQASKRPRYGSRFTGPVPDVRQAVRETITLVRNCGAEYEFRTTVAPGLAREDLIAIAHEIRGSQRYVLQPLFVPPGKRLVDEALRTRPSLSREELQELAAEISRLGPCSVRG